MERYIQVYNRIYDTQEKEFYRWHQIKENKLYNLIMPYGDERDLDRDDYKYWGCIEKSSDNVKDFIEVDDLVRYNNRKQIAQVRVSYDHGLYFNNHYVDWENDIINEIWRYHKINDTYECVWRDKEHSGTRRNS